MVMNEYVNEQPLLFTADRWDIPIGLARDGHLIMGPYKNSSGDEWSCEDRDQCNGAFIDGQYVYVGSHEFPYVVGCWGPGPEVEYAPDCSNNTCGSTDSSTTPGAEEDDDNSDDGSDSSDTGAMSIVANIGAALTAFVALNF